MKARLISREVLPFYLALLALGVCAWAGSLLVLVHAGIHFNAILGWLAVWAMLISVGSGLTGKFLLQRSRKRLDAARSRMQLRGIVSEDLEERLYWDSLTFEVKAPKQQALFSRASAPAHAGALRVLPRRTEEQLSS